MSILNRPTNDFGFRFLEYHNSNASPKNVLFSPLSAILTYGILLEGATGETEEQIKGVLQLTSVGNQTSDVSDASKKLLDGYKLVEDGSSGRNFTLAIANLAMLNKRAKLQPAYAQRLLTNYFAQVTNEDFENNTAVMDKVNSWVAEKTRHKIDKILTNPPDKETILMLINTIYFKGQWEKPFLKGATYDGTFNNADGTKSKVKMMTIYDKKFNFTYDQDKKVKIVELPYQGNVSMIFILPTEFNTIINMATTLNATKLDNLLSSLRQTKLTSLSIPKFRLEDEHKLDRILPSMGMTRVFSDSAELPNIAEGGNLKVSRSIQKTLLEVDEEGSVAAASTIIETVLLMSLSPAVDFVADRPFMFIIRDNLSGVNLFMGQMVKMSCTKIDTTAAPSV